MANELLHGGFTYLLIKSFNILLETDKFVCQQGRQHESSRTH